MTNRVSSSRRRRLSYNFGCKADRPAAGDRGRSDDARSALDGRFRSGLGSPSHPRAPTNRRVAPSARYDEHAASSCKDVGRTSPNGQTQRNEEHPEHEAERGKGLHWSHEGTEGILALPVPEASESQRDRNHHRCNRAENHQDEKEDSVEQIHSFSVRVCSELRVATTYVLEVPFWGGFVTPGDQGCSSPHERLAHPVPWTPLTASHQRASGGAKCGRTLANQASLASSPTLEGAPPGCAYGARPDVPDRGWHPRVVPHVFSRVIVQSRAASSSGRAGDF